MKKRILAMLLAVWMVLGLVGCGGTEEPPAEPEPEVPSVELGGLFLSSVVVLLQPGNEKRSRTSSRVIFFITVVLSVFIAKIYYNRREQ